MKVSPLSPRHQALHDAAVAAARGVESAEGRLIEALIAVDREKVFVRLGYNSLTAYAVGALKLTGPMANQSVTVARRAAAIPELRSEIQRGEIGVSTAKKMASVIKPGNQTEWLAKARTLTSHQLEKAVAKANPKAATPEKAKYVSEHRLSLSFGITEEAMLKLRRAQDQLSRSLGRAATLEETLAKTVEFYLHYHDPVEKARRIVAKNGFSQPKSAESRGGGGVPKDSERAPVEATANEPPVTQSALPQSPVPQPPLLQPPPGQGSETPSVPRPNRPRRRLIGRPK